MGREADLIVFIYILRHLQVREKSRRRDSLLLSRDKHCYCWFSRRDLYESQLAHVVAPS